MDKRNIYTIILIVAAAFLSAIVTLIIVDSSDTPSSYDKVTIQSSFLKEKREIIIKKPRNYVANKKYPVVFVLGGNSLTYSVVHDLSLLSRVGNIPDVIVVGVTNIDQKSRQRDLTPPFLKQDLDDKDSSLGEADNYLDFIEKEVIRFVKENYNVSKKIVIGHSREGLLVMYSIMARPKLFDARIALSPALWRENNVFVKQFGEFLSKNKQVDGDLFISMGKKEVNKMKNAFELTIQTLNSNAPETFKWKSFYMPNATHQTNHYLTAAIGVDHIFNKR
ncbi:alpha/beta hydrolase [Muricauda sp. NFXS6]|uniref:alpha/beta hydrolase n=1 Tax=Allomuricauda sp. NFXS6 TaxID=2819094 RepID=UPI0032DF9206